MVESFQWVATWALLAGAGAMFLVYLTLRFGPCAVRFGDAAFRHYIALPFLGKVLLPVLFGVAFVYGSTKTNGVCRSGLMMLTLRNDVAQVWQSVGANVVRAEVLYRCGATEDALCLPFDEGFVFPDGTNHLDRVVVLSSGEVRRSLQDRDALVRFGERLWSRPYVSELTAEHTPSNSCRIVWQDFYANGDTNLPRTVSAELFRNGDLAVGESGGTTLVPREIPFPHDGFGQDDDWVRANFTNAAEVLAVGYADWVDGQVGVDLENGLYKFTATFPDVPPEATRLWVGDKVVCVTNAGEYVFLLEKGVEYGFGTEPYDDTVEYTMQDDVAPSAPVFAAWWGGNAHGEWTVDGGWHWIDTPSVWGFGACLWMPKFRGSPDVEHLDVGDFPVTFTALLADFCRTNDVTYRWTTSTEGVRIVSPNVCTTEVEADFIPSWDTFSLAVEAQLPGETLTSMLRTTYGTNSMPQVSVELSMPKVMFTNDDDDDDNGIADSSQVPADDDDVVNGYLTFHSDAETNATVRIESISGFDAGFVEDTEDFVFSDSACTHPVQEGAEFEVSNGRNLYVPLYFNPVACSSSYEDIEITASVTLESGERREVTATATVISPIVEPICNETKSVEIDGESHTLTYNPCGVGIGEKAYFKIRVTPDDFPDGRIVWESEGGLAFVGGNTGREVCVQGTAAGRTTLRIRLRESELDIPSFPVIVVPVTTIGIRALIVSDGYRQAQSESMVREMVKTANDIYAQIGMRFMLESIAVTNLPDAFVITETNVFEHVWSHNRLTSLLPGGNGIECYFVSDISDEQMISLGCRGMTSSSGVVITESSTITTLSHEIGHLCGVCDIYDQEDGFATNADTVSFENALEDWNGGCLGQGRPGARYYPHGLSMKNAIGRLLMQGRSNENDLRRDMTLGDVFGVWYHEDSDNRRIYQKSIAPVGFGTSRGFRMPQCQ